MDLHVVTYLVGSYRVLNFSDENNDDMNTMVVAKTNMGYLCDIEMIMDKQYQLHKKCHFTSMFTQAM